MKTNKDLYEMLLQVVQKLDMVLSRQETKAGRVQANAITYQKRKDRKLLSENERRLRTVQNPDSSAFEWKGSDLWDVADAFAKQHKMAVSMLLFMWGMYENKKLNYLIIAGAVVLGVFTYGILRDQTFVDDKAWMRAMIPHHSSAIMVSQKAQLKDPEAIKLAEDIIAAQKREIAQMKAMLERLDQ